MHSSNNVLIASHPKSLKLAFVKAKLAIKEIIFSVSSKAFCKQVEAPGEELY